MLEKLVNLFDIPAEIPDKKRPYVRKQMVYWFGSSYLLSLLLKYCITLMQRAYRL